MKKFFGYTVSIMAIFVANNASAADGYTCETSRVFTSCGAGWYLQESVAGSGEGTCYECPTNFKSGAAGIVGKDNCVGNIAAGYYYDKENETRKTCPQGASYFCPGVSNITYGNASRSTTTTPCYDPSNPNAMTAGLKNVIGYSNITRLELGSYGIPEGVQVITWKPVVVNSGGASSYEHCAFDWTQSTNNYKIQIIPQNSLTGSGVATLNITSCSSGQLSSVRNVKFNEIDITTGGSPLFSTGCAGCGEGKYLKSGATECSACNIHDALGLDTSVTAIWQSGLAESTVGSWVCPYRFETLPVENGVATGISCSMTDVANGTYSCRLSLDIGQLGCDAGYILQNADMTSETLINCGGQDNSYGQSVNADTDLAIGLEILTPSNLKCVPTRMGCYQPNGQDEFAEITNAADLITALTGKPCGDGNYCDKSASAEQTACPAVKLFMREDGSAVNMMSADYADDAADCYVPANPDILYKDGNGNLFYLESKCGY